MWVFGGNPSLPMFFGLFCFCFSKELQGLVLWEKHQLRIGPDDFEMSEGYPGWEEQQEVLCLSVKCRGSHCPRHRDLGLTAYWVQGIGTVLPHKWADKNSDASASDPGNAKISMPLLFMDGGGWHGKANSQSFGEKHGITKRLVATRTLGIIAVYK